jgi:ABC-type oligopeptide transport system substrate-binding subunit
MRFRTIFAAALIICQPVWGDTLRRGLGPEPDSLHIHQAQGLSAIHLLREIREGLVTFNAEGELVPGVAESWEVLDDGKLYRFNLRKNARWSNGDALTATDFVRAWRKAVSPASASRNASLLAAVENSEEILTGDTQPELLGIKAVDDHTLEVHLIRSQPWFEEILTHPVTYPLHSSEAATPRNPHFHAADSVKLDTLELLPIEDPAAELSRYRAGELHITESIPPGRYQWLSENHPDELRISPYLGSFWLGYNIANKPFKGDVNLRKALSLAIDRETLVRVVLGAGEIPAWGVIPPGMTGHVPEISTSNQAERNAEARRLFRQAGYGPGKPLRLELRYNTSSQHRRMAVAVSAMWKQVLGVASVLINEEWKVFVNNRSQGVLTQVFRGGWIADYADPASFLDLFRSENALNWSAYSNPAYDELMDQSTRLNGTTRIEVIKQAESMLMRDMPVIPLYYYVSRHLVSTGVRGYQDNVRDIHLSRYLEIETDTQ